MIARPARRVGVPDRARARLAALGSADIDILFPGSSIFLGLPDLLPRGERFCGQAKPEQGGASPGAVAEIDQARPLIGPTRRSVVA
jgi:hypothetical protein